VVGPSGWRSCCNRRTTPPATNETSDERSTQLPHQFERRRRPRSATPIDSAARASRPSNDDADPDVLHRSTQLPVQVRTSTWPCYTEDLGGPDLLHNTAKLPRGGGSLSPSNLKPVNLDVFPRPTSTTQRQSIHIESNALHGIQPRPCITSRPC